MFTLYNVDVGNMRQAVMFLWVAVGIHTDYDLGAVFKMWYEYKCCALDKNHYACCEKVSELDRLLCGGYLQCITTYTYTK